ncbi:hypothetical protein HHI36_015523 [Cryptolaemus montrouzieri]|uniref:C2H2-type domain-containing protein n=1 Tax=Cryptolaemus montrouzieri TaxID=559131 RepID=A0ABD2N6D4_9CUCU
MESIKVKIENEDNRISAPHTEFVECGTRVPKEEPDELTLERILGVDSTYGGIKNRNEIESTENEINTVAYIKDECEFIELNENEIKDEVVSDNEPEGESYIALERPLGDDIFRVCRTCLKIAKVEDIIPLVAHGPGSKTELYKRLTGFLGSDILSVENPCICINCERFLNAVHDFNTTFNANEMVLREFDWDKKTKDLLHIVDQDTLKNMYNESCRESNKVSSCTTLQENMAHSTKDFESDWVDKWKELDEKGNGLSDMEDHWYRTDETKASNHDYALLETTNPACCLHEENIDIFSPIFDRYLQKVGGKTTERLQKKINRFHDNDEGNGPFICEFCGKVISSKVLFSRHSSKHRLDGFQCKICSKVLPEWNSYKNHCKLLHGELPKRFECPSCNKQYRSQNLLESHIQIHKIENSKYSCSICREAFESKVDFEKHRIVHRPQKGFHKICGLGFFKNDLRRHMMLKHVLGDVSGLKNVKKLFVCDLCGKKYFKKGSLKLHKKHCKDDDSSGSLKIREQQSQEEDDEQDFIIENYEVIANETKDSVQILIYND